MKGWKWKTSKKVDDKTGGWIADVTIAAGAIYTVHQRRGSFRRSFFGNDQYHWDAVVTFPDGFAGTLTTGPGDSAQGIVRRAMGLR